MGDEHGVVNLVMVMAYQIRTQKTAPVLILQELHRLPSEFPDGCDVASRPVDVPNEHLRNLKSTKICNFGTILYLIWHHLDAYQAVTEQFQCFLRLFF